MESVQTSQLFTLSVDATTKTHLSEAAKWARFLAIMGFIFLGLMIIGGIFAAVMMATTASQFDSEYGSSGAGLMMGSFGAGMAIIYIVLAAVLLSLLVFVPVCQQNKAGFSQQRPNRPEFRNSEFEIYVPVHGHSHHSDTGVLCDCIYLRNTWRSYFFLNQPQMINKKPLDEAFYFVAR